MPMITRATTRTASTFAAALASEPTMKTTAEPTIRMRRPYWSERRPAKAAPTTAPIGTAATTSPEPKLESPKSGSMKSRALAMTPVS